MTRWLVSLLMLVVAAAFGPPALAHGGSHHRGQGAAVHQAQPPACAGKAAETPELMVSAPLSLPLSLPCHGAGMPGMSCCCPVACAALIAPVADLVFSRPVQSSRTQERRGAFPDLRQGPPLPPPRD
jgi:hypothetical protein